MSRADGTRRKRFPDDPSAASVLSSAGIETSEDLVRFLKSALPDDEASKRKIQNVKIKVAWAAWAADESVLFLPRKAEMLADWVLTTICSVALDEQDEVDESEYRGKPSWLNKVGRNDAPDDPHAALADLRGLLEELCEEENSHDGGGRKLVLALSAKHPILNLIQSFLKTKPESSTVARWSATITVLTGILEHSSVQSRVTKFEQVLDCLVAIFHLQTHFKRAIKGEKLSELKQRGHVNALNSTTRLEDTLLQALLASVENQVHAKKVSANRSFRECSLTRKCRPPCVCSRMNNCCLK